MSGPKRVSELMRMVEVLAHDCPCTGCQGDLTQWGPWVLDADNLALSGEGYGWEYWVDLRRCRTSAEMLDWIMQVAGKPWATDEILANLVRALSDIIHPQANLCPFGQSKTLSLDSLRRLVKFRA